MPEKESGTPEEYKNFKVEDSPGQVKEGSFERTTNKAKAWLEERKQTKEAHELNSEYDELLNEFSEKIDDIASEGAWTIGKEEQDAAVERIKPMIPEARALADKIRQFEKEKLGMSGESSRLQKEVDWLEAIIENWS